MSFSAVYESDLEAWEVLESKFYVARPGIIQPRIPGYRATKAEAYAIYYLVSEWDYGYED